MACVFLLSLFAIWCKRSRILVEHLGVRQLAMVAGGSIGGQQALEWAVTYPELVQKAYRRGSDGGAYRAGNRL